jgi:arsenate reductase
MEKIIVYGISNCDTIKKTLAWFKKNNINVEFHDYKIDGISKEKLLAWINQAGLETILNKRSTTWRELSAAEQDKITDRRAAMKLMIEHNSIIKRPVIEYRDKILVGYNDTEFHNIFLIK